MYGARYVSSYEKKIEEMFHQGEKEKSRKLGPARMLEYLIAMYPHRYNLPGVNEIRGLITKLMKKRRQFSAQGASPPIDNTAGSMHSSDELTPALEDNSVVPMTTRQKKRRMSPTYAIFLANVVDENPRIMPKKALVVFREHFRDWYPDENQIRAKVSAPKRKPNTLINTSSSMASD
ncbi:hypothetical protein PHMEG_00019595 [Phytophthora megakarya]|uniref:Uncharacterized protein n=1 Tax=Phytophthora megakarya TaxID=4795 RepID=A0A225VSQ2_9STRA|nr:hypothetical protein PHMEG_00019595 [Phytophthora megakarya]